MRARKGHLDCLKYLHETAKAPWDYLAVREAHNSEQTECLQYLLDNDCPLPEGWSYEDGELQNQNQKRKRKKNHRHGKKENTGKKKDEWI